MTAPYFRHEKITPSDSLRLPKYGAILVISGGDITMEDRVGAVITYKQCPAYTTFEGFMPAKVLASGTTATDIIGWRYEGE